jgi:transcriptional regulator with XRE-family HTH domain
MSIPKGKQRTKVQDAIVALRKARDLSQQDLAVLLKCNTASIGKWEAIREPRGLSLMELAGVARSFGREDLYEVFTDELEGQLEVLNSTGHPTNALEVAICRLYHWAHLPQPARASKNQGRREYMKALHAIVAGHAAFVRDVAKGRVSGWLMAEVEELQMEIEELEDREARRED